jgi:hypothetical protein
VLRERASPPVSPDSHDDARRPAGSKVRSVRRGDERGRRTLWLVPLRRRAASTLSRS